MHHQLNGAPSVNGVAPRGEPIFTRLHMPRQPAGAQLVIQVWQQTPDGERSLLLEQTSPANYTVAIRLEPDALAHGEASEQPPSPAAFVPDELQDAILRIIRQAGRRLTAAHIGEALVREGMEHGTKTIFVRLRQLCLREILDNPKVAGQGHLGYGPVEWGRCKTAPAVAECSGAAH